MLSSLDNDLDELVIELVGEPCETKDTDDFHNLKYGERCLTCKTYEQLDVVKSKLQKHIEIENLRSRIDLLIGFRRRDFVSDDFYENSVLDRITELEKKLKQLEEK